MARRYDTKTTIFSPEGRLYQVEYAMTALNEAGTCIAIVASDGVVLVAEKKGGTDRLLDNTIDKIFKINDDMICAVAGIASDALVLMSELRQIAQRYTEQYGVSISCERLVRYLSDVKQAYTQFGGKRPFGVSILYAGWDQQYGYQVYKSDPSGDYSGWKACSIGRNNELALDILEREYQNTCMLSETIKLAIKVLLKVTNKTDLTAERIEMISLSKDGIYKFTGQAKEALVQHCKAEIATEPNTEIRMIVSGEQGDC